VLEGRRRFMGARNSEHSRYFGGDIVPTEQRGAALASRNQPLAEIAVGNCTFYSAANIGHIQRIDEDGGISDDLRQGGNTRDHNRRAASHGLDWRKAKAFGKAGLNQ
jgi:hypothetical protein